MDVSTSARMYVCARGVQYIQSQCALGFLCDCTVYKLMHIYDCVFVCLCVYIKQPLTAIGGGGGPAGVFALAAIQHSTFLCDIQYCDLRKPALQRSSLSFSYVPPLSLQPLFLSLPCHLPTSLSLFLSFPPFLSIIFSALFSYLNLGNHLSSTPPPPSTLHPNPRFIFPPSFSLKVSSQRSPFFSDRGPLTRHLSHCSKSEHTSRSSH